MNTNSTNAFLNKIKMQIHDFTNCKLKLTDVFSTNFVLSLVAHLSSSQTSISEFFSFSLFSFSLDLSFIRHRLEVKLLISSVFLCFLLVSGCYHNSMPSSCEIDSALSVMVSCSMSVAINLDIQLDENFPYDGAYGRLTYDL